MFLKIEELKHVVIGRIKDAGYNAIQIDCNEWLTLYPQLTDYRIEVISPSGEIYFADTTMQGGVITWNLTARDTFQVGNGQYQVVAVGENGERKTSSHPKITILEIANGTDADVPPDLSDAWTDTVIRNANAAIDAAEISKQNSEAAIDSANRTIALAEEISEATNRAEDAAERAEAAAERAESAGGSGGSAGGIVTETDPTVYDWAKQPQKPTYTADEVNAIDKDALPQAIEAALAQAKENGEFDGAPGSKGDPGADGGYYQPSVTDGVLSWTPSKADMPSVPASDVRGPAGQDGQPGKDGIPGKDGKTAYQYARDGGYTGTEAEFAQKMAQEIPEPYTLPAATADRLGGVIIGDGLQVDENGRTSTRNNLSLYTSREVKDGETVNTIREDLPGNIREVQIFIFFPKGAANNIRVTGSIGGASFYIPDAFTPNSDMWCVLRYRPGRGTLSLSGEYAAKEGYTTPVKMIGMHLKPSPYDSVGQYGFQLNNIAEGYRVGTKVDIYIG